MSSLQKKDIWYVVIFEDDSVECIPDTWILNDGKQAIWPPTEKKNVIDKAIANRTLPTEKEWSIHNIKKVWWNLRKYFYLIFFLQNNLMLCK